MNSYIVGDVERSSATMDSVTIYLPETTTEKGEALGTR